MMGRDDLKTYDKKSAYPHGLSPNPGIGSWRRQVGSQENENSEYGKGVRRWGSVRHARGWVLFVLALGFLWGCLEYLLCSAG